MNEKVITGLAVIIVTAAFVLGGTAGFLIGRGNPVRSAGSGHTDREPAAAAGELGAELGRERIITEGLGSKQDEERVLIRDALDACGRAGGGVRGVIEKMEILNGLVRELEFRAGGGAGVSGGG
jgi:hypothetical protein